MGFVVDKTSRLSGRRYEDSQNEWPRDTLSPEQTRSVSKMRPSGDLPEGIRLCDGRYEVSAVIGRGTTSTVYRAEQVRMKRQVALKVYREAFMQGADAHQLIQREAAAVSALSHPNLVLPLDCEDDAGLHFLVMEMLWGETIAARLAGGRTLSPATAIAIITDLLSALAAMHDTGIVHLDVNPENIVLAPRSREAAGAPLVAKLCDLGSVHHMHEGPRVRPPTELLDAFAEYRSPEWLVGGPVDGRSDLYSVAVLLSYMVAGVSPGAFLGRDSDSAVTNTRAGPRDDGASFSLVAEIVRRAWATEPRDRYGDAREMRTALMQPVSSIDLPRAELAAWSPAGIRVPGREVRALSTVAPRLRSEAATLAAAVRVPPRSHAGPLLHTVRHKCRPPNWVQGRTVRMRRAQESGPTGMMLAGLLCLAAVIWFSSGGLGPRTLRLCERVDCDGVLAWGKDAAEKGAETIRNFAEKGTAAASRWGRRWFERLHDEL